MSSNRFDNHVFCCMEQKYILSNTSSYEISYKKKLLFYGKRHKSREYDTLNQLTIIKNMLILNFFHKKCVRKHYC